MMQELIPTNGNTQENPKGLSTISTLPKSLGLLLHKLYKKGESLNVHEFIKAQSAITVFSALQTPQVSRLNKESPGDLNFAISELLKFVKQLFNLPEEKNLSNLQISLLANDIRQRYWFLKFDELVYILREGVAGRWGRSYSRMDTETVHSWFNTYINTERDAVIEQASHNAAVQFKKQEAAPVSDPKPMPDHIRQELEALRQKLEGEAQMAAAVQVPVLSHEAYLSQLTETAADLEPATLKELHREAQIALNPEVARIIEAELTKRGEGYTPYKGRTGNAA